MALSRRWPSLGFPTPPANAQVSLYAPPVQARAFRLSWCVLCSRAADGGEDEDGAFAGAEELFGTTSESDTSTFHGFEDDELEEPAANGNGIPARHR